MDPGRTGRAGELDSGSKNSWSSAAGLPGGLGLGFSVRTLGSHPQLRPDRGRPLGLRQPIPEKVGGGGVASSIWTSC